jgi:hypothetical protein
MRVVQFACGVGMPSREKCQERQRRISHNAHACTRAPARINVAALLIACGSRTGIKACRQKQGEQANTAQNQKKQNWTSQTGSTRWQKGRKCRPESARRSKKPEKISTAASAVTKHSRRCVRRYACVYVYSISQSTWTKQCS